jgi:hypothetical protein
MFSLSLILTAYFTIVFFGKPSFEIFIDNDHSIIKTALKTFAQLLPIFIFSITITINNFLNFKIPTHIRITINIIVFSMILYRWINPDGANWASAHFLLVLIIFPFLITHFFYEEKKTAVIWILYGLIAAAGSNTGFLKVSHGFIFLVPIMTEHYLTNYKPTKYNNILYFPTSIVLIFIFKLTYMNGYEDESFRNLFSNRGKIINPICSKTNNITSQKQNDTFILSSMSAIEEIKGKTLFYGYPGWMLKYLKPEKVLLLPSFTQNVIFQNEITQIKNYSRQKGVYFIMISKSNTEFYKPNYKILNTNFCLFKESPYFAIFKLPNCKQPKYRSKSHVRPEFPVATAK